MSLYEERIKHLEAALESKHKAHLEEQEDLQKSQSLQQSAIQRLGEEKADLMKSSEQIALQN